MSDKPTCVLCGRPLPREAGGDPKAASVEHCSPYDFDIIPESGAPGPEQTYTEEQRRKHRAWVESKGAGILKAERTAKRVKGEVRERRIDDEEWRP